MKATEKILPLPLMEPPTAPQSNLHPMFGGILETTFRGIREDAVFHVYEKARKETEKQNEAREKFVMEGAK